VCPAQPVPFPAHQPALFQSSNSESATKHHTEDSDKLTFANDSARDQAGRTFLQQAQMDRECGNHLVQRTEFQHATHSYLRTLHQLRPFEIHPHIPWQQDHLKEFRELRAATYLNLSLCYLKLHQWMHAANAATEAMMGPEQEANQYVDMLTPTQKIKALCRRAQACFEGLQDLQTANEDLKLACAVSPKNPMIRDTMLHFQTVCARSLTS
jgi:hypothetical protein